MEENKEKDKDEGLELSLGLACGLTTSASNDKSLDSPDDKTDADERTSKILNDFRNFLNAGSQQSFQRTDPIKPQENFFNHIHRTTSGENDSTNGAGTSENKRKNAFDETERTKRQETESRSSNLQDKEKNYHISITTDEGSTEDNDNDDDVAESEAEGSTSRMVPHQDDGSRTPGGSGSSSQAPNVVNVSSSSLPVQTMNTSNVPYSITVRESSPGNLPSTSMYPLSMNNIPPSNGHSIPYSASTSVPMTFTHSSAQIPDKGSSWGIGRPPPPHSPYAGRPTPTSVSMQVTNLTPSEATHPDAHPPHQPMQGSFQPESNATHAGPRSDSFPSEYPAIRPGIASEVKFGGSGSFPNLPWVSTTAPGPNGKTISGVTYKFNATQIKIVCACHGVHLSPEEFVRHATEDQTNAVATAGLAPLQSSGFWHVATKMAKVTQPKEQEEWNLPMQRANGNCHWALWHYGKALASRLYLSYIQFMNMLCIYSHNQMSAFSCFS